MDDEAIVNAILLCDKIEHTILKYLMRHAMDQNFDFNQITRLSKLENIVTHDTVSDDSQ